MSRLAKISGLGQQIWLDNLTRGLLERGELARWIATDAIAGVTSNPAIFYNALQNDPTYATDLARVRMETKDVEARFEALALPDVQRACDLLRPLHEATRSESGFVSFEVSPALARDVAGTLAAARRLWRAIGRPNAMIKIPATPEGITALETAIAEGISVNVTLIFSLAQLAAVQAAHRRGLEARVARGESLTGLASVASVFISRVDSLLDPLLPPVLQGKTAIALARVAYARWRAQPPLPQGASPQRLLWASTSSKNPAYRDVLYVEELIGADTINTVPDATLAAFRDHGEARLTLTDAQEAEAILDAVTAAGIDLEATGEKLLQAGLAQFAEAFAKLLTLMR
ncbi:MAG: transaldolase [Zoogloeaceae bacterium]|jgi:transaldolase|nr:transaldolase [Zoogloeaceae bacterium]